MISRRAFMAAAAASLATPARSVVYPDVVRGRALAFPRDHGRHADFRTEWWYITGWLETDHGPALGVQITFFRNRPGVAEQLSSRFAARQLLFAHAAVSDPRHGRLRHDQRAAREGFGLAQAADATTDVSIGDWSLALDGDRYRARIPARDFALDLAFAARQPILLQGDAGYSRKGPQPNQASYYYSRPHLEFAGRIEVGTERRDARGVAWLDHEWSSEYLAGDAAGWDWTGINLDDGGAVMAFRIRKRDGGVLWAGGAVRADGVTRSMEHDEIVFAPRREWTSPRTGNRYPVEIDVRAANLALTLQPLQDDQELDSRASTGTVYWEGAVTAMANGRRVGRGYLELTGYGTPLVL